MEFETKSVWFIVITLLLVTIFIIIWYIYQEFLFTKKKTKELKDANDLLVENINKINRVIFSSSPGEELECEESESDEENEDECESDCEGSEEENEYESECDIEDEREESEEIGDNCGNHLHHEEFNDVDGVGSCKIEEIEEICSGENGIEYTYDASSLIPGSEKLCNHILTSGKRKGDQCGKKCKGTDEKCKTHI